MIPSISNSQSTALPSATDQVAKTVQTSAGISASKANESNGTQDTETVNVSSLSKQLSAQSTKWASMSKQELAAAYDKTWAEFVAFDERISADGRLTAEGIAIINADMPKSDDPARLEVAKRAAAFNVSVHSTPPGAAPNPFSNRPRDELASISYDDSGTYTISERYAAIEELQKQDYVKMTNLFAGITNGGDNRFLYTGLLAYLDGLSPIEQSIYPEGHREKLVGFLEQEEARFGKSGKIASSEQAVSGSTPRWTLDASKPIWSQLVTFADSVSSGA